ncbi:hypothetical protein D3C77_807220 [compost metagenome]
MGVVHGQQVHADAVAQLAMQRQAHIQGVQRIDAHGQRDQAASGLRRGGCRGGLGLAIMA